jgi:enoyl-CoA hydratase
MGTTVTVRAEGPIAEVALACKTMPPAMFGELEAAFRQVSVTRDVRAVLLYSEAEHFSYGLDLREAFREYGELFTGGGLAGPRTELLELIRSLQRSTTAVAKCPAPVVAAVHGWCIGGGLDLIAACDVRTASADARFSLRETKLGIVADLGSLQRLPRIIGQGHARELAFTGKTIDAERALAIGLVSDVASDRDSCLRAARAIAEEIADNPPLVVRGVKQVMNYGEDKSVDDGLEYVAAWNAAFLASEDLGEAVAALAARRKPRFTGK